jgi:DNA-binding transcriptional LysR family regulator
MTIELRDLRWAIAASQHRSLRQAANALNVRQSTLSRCLREMEDGLGVLLFERTRGGSRPTAAGQEFLAAARRIVDEADTVFSRMRLRRRGETGQLIIGLYTAISAGVLRATLADYHRRFPDVEICAVDGSRRHLLADLAADAIDVAIMTASDLQWSDKTLSLWSERIVIALPEGHPLAALPILHWGDLREESLLFNQREPGPEFQHVLLTKLGYHSKLRIMQHEVGLDRLLSLVAAGLGITLVAEGAIGAIKDSVAFREIHDENGPTRVTFTACWRQGNNNTTLAPFLSILRERYPDLAAPSVVGDH